MGTYASKYYDPQKAHEYYEAHKKQTARTSTKGFNESQKAMAAYVKAQLTEEKKEKNAKVTETHNALAKEQRQAFTDQCSEKVKALREKMKGMSSEEKAAIKERISEIKEVFKQAKKAVTTMHSGQKKAEKAVNQKEYQDKYQQALQEIRSGK